MTIKLRTLVLFLVAFIVLLQLIGGHDSKEYNDIYKTVHRDVDFEVYYESLIFDIKTMQTKMYPQVHSEVKNDGLGKCTLEGKGYTIKAENMSCESYIGDELVYSFNRHSINTPVGESSRLKVPFVAWIVIVFVLYAVFYTLMHYIFRRFVYKGTLTLA